MSEEFQFELEDFVQDMQMFESMFPGVYIEVREIDDGVLYFAKIANHSTTVSSYQEVKDFFLSFKGQELPQDPEVLKNTQQ